MASAVLLAGCLKEPGQGSDSIRQESAQLLQCRTSPMVLTKIRALLAILAATAVLAAIVRSQVPAPRPKNDSHRHAQERPAIRSDAQDLDTSIRNGLVEAGWDPE